MTFLSKRLATDAKTVLQNAGFHIVERGPHRRPYAMCAQSAAVPSHYITLDIIGSCVDNAIVYLRDAHKGEGDECWVPCAKGDPGAFAFIQQV
jgi:hypothetical protein